MKYMNRHEEIYFEAAKLFNKKGFASTSMNDIAAAVGITKAGLYYFVKGKEDLLNTIITYSMDRFVAEVVEPAQQEPDPVARLMLMVRLHVHNVGSSQWEGGNPLTIIVSETVGLGEENLKPINSIKRRYLELIRSTLIELRESGELADGIDITAAAFGIVGMVLHMPRWFRLDGRLSLDTVADSFVNIALGGVLKNPAKALSMAKSAAVVNG